MADNKDISVFIDETAIGTPNDGFGLNLCTGAALYPPFPNIPIGWQMQGPVGELKAGKNFDGLITKISGSFGFGIHAGLCGPSYAIKLLATGDVEGEILTLEIDDDEVMAGIFLGVGANVELALKWQTYVLEPLNPLGDWQSQVDLNFSADVDLFKFAGDFILALLDIEDIFSKAATEAAVDTPLAMVGETTQSYNLNKGVIEVTPDFEIPINLWGLVVAAAVASVESPSSWAILAAHEVMEKTLSSVGFGPTVGLLTPIDIQIKEVALDDVWFEQSSLPTGYDEEEGVWEGKLKDRTQQIPEEPEEMSITFEHNVNFSFSIGLYVEVQILELFHMGAAASMEIPGARTHLGGPYQHTFTNIIGEDRLLAECDCSGMTKSAGMVDVEFT